MRLSADGVAGLSGLISSLLSYLRLEVVYHEKHSTEIERTWMQRQQSPSCSHVFNVILIYIAGIWTAMPLESM